MSIPEGFKLVPAEPTAEMYASASVDSREQGFLGAGYRAMLSAAPTPPQPIYDEAKERELFEATRNAHTVRRNEHGDYVLPSAQDAWSGWSQCAQSRAKSVEVGDE